MAALDCFANWRQASSYSQSGHCFVLCASVNVHTVNLSLQLLSSCWLKDCLCVVVFVLQEISNVLKGALDRLRTDDPPASMSRVNFRYEFVCVLAADRSYRSWVQQHWWRLGLTLQSFVWHPDTLTGLNSLMCLCDSLPVPVLEQSWGFNWSQRAVPLLLSLLWADTMSGVYSNWCERCWHDVQAIY